MYSVASYLYVYYLAAMDDCVMYAWFRHDHKRLGSPVVTVIRMHGIVGQASITIIAFNQVIV